MLVLPCLLCRLLLPGILESAFLSNRCDDRCEDVLSDIQKTAFKSWKGLLLILFDILCEDDGHESTSH